MPDPFDETDAVLAQKLAEIQPPAGLRARLLALEPVSVPRHEPAWWSRGISALAAAILTLLAVTSLFTGGGNSLNAVTNHFAAFLSGPFDLVVQTTSLPNIDTWLASANTSMKVPGPLQSQTPIGCRRVEWQGHQGMLVCFQLHGGGEAHLVMFRSSDLAAPASPQLADAGNWQRAAWSRGGTTYLLFTPKGRMNEVLRFAAAQRTGNSASSRPNKSLFAAANAVSARARISEPV